MIRSLNNPILLQLIMVSANALLEIVQRATHSLYTVTMHRRDLHLHGKPCYDALNPDGFTTRRTAPCLGASSLFDADTVIHINNEHVNN